MVQLVDEADKDAPAVAGIAGASVIREAEADALVAGAGTESRHALVFEVVVEFKPVEAPRADKADEPEAVAEIQAAVVVVAVVARKAAVVAVVVAPVEALGADKADGPAAVAAIQAAVVVVALAAVKAAVVAVSVAPKKPAYACEEL
jgi:hypothetical protein